VARALALDPLRGDFTTDKKLILQKMAGAGAIIYPWIGANPSVLDDPMCAAAAAAAVDGGTEMTTERIRILSPKETYAVTSLSPRSQKRLAEKGRFPKPIRLDEQSPRIGFVESEVQAWLAARLAEARRPPPAGAEPQAAEPTANGHSAEAPASRPPKRRRDQPGTRPHGV
jgi:predicted DNA-binding transcriptional regulator AlpA